MPTIRQFIAITLALTMVFGAGCSGWGTDGPADTGNTNDSLDDRENGSEPNGSESPQTGDGNGEGNDSSGGDSSQAGTENTTNGSAGSPDSTSDGDNQSQSGTSSSDDMPRPDEDTSDETNSSDTAQNDSSPNSGPDASGSSDTAQNDSESDKNKTYTLTVDTSVTDIPVTLERHSDGATTTTPTDSSGVVQFEVYPGEYTVSAEDTDGTTAEATVIVESNREVTLSGLEGDQQTSSQTVEIVHANEDAPLPSTVTLTDTEGNTYSQDTGDDGVAEFNVPDGEYDYEIKPHQDGDFQVAMSYAGDLVVGDDTFPDPFEIQMYSPPADMEASITVVDATTGEPIEGATIQGVSPNMNHPWKPTFNVDTDATGHYNGTIPNTVTTGYDYDVNAEGYQAHGGSGMTAHELSNQTFELERTVHTLAVDTGKSGVPVTIERWDGETTTKETDADGATEFSVYHGGYEVTADGYEARQVDVESDTTIQLQSSTAVVAA